MRISKNWLWILLMAAGLCGTCAAQASGSNAPSQPQAADQSKDIDQSRHETHDIKPDSYIPERPAARPVALKHPSNQCVTQHDPRDGCTVDRYGEKGSPCKCVTDDEEETVRGKLE
jgi:hypothetical protein